MDRELEKAEKKRRTAALLEEKRVTEGARETLLSPNGRAFLWRILQISGWGAQPYTANALNTAFACGRLDVGNQLVALLGETDPAVFVRMQQERLENDRRDRTDADARTNTSTDGPAGSDADSD